MVVPFWVSIATPVPGTFQLCEFPESVRYPMAALCLCHIYSDLLKLGILGDLGVVSLSLTVMGLPVFWTGIVCSVIFSTCLTVPWEVLVSSGAVRTNPKLIFRINWEVNIKPSCMLWWLQCSDCSIAAAMRLIRIINGFVMTDRNVFSIWSLLA